MSEETVGEAAHLYTAPHPPRKDSAEYLKSRKTMMQLHPTCYVCGGSEQIEDHHSGALLLSDGCIPVMNMFGLEWSLGFSADPQVVQAKILELNRVLAALGEPTYDLPVTDTDSVMAWVDSLHNASLPLCVAGGTEVLMADGTTKPIENVAVGDSVIGGDGDAHRVRKVLVRRYEGSLVRVGEAGPLVTPQHPVLTSEGWSAAGSITSNDSVYRLTPGCAGGAPRSLLLGRVEYPQISLREMLDRVACSDQVGVTGSVLFDSPAMPVDARSLNDDSVVGQQRVNSPSSDDTLTFVPDALGVQGLIEPPLNTAGLLCTCSAMTVLAVGPEAIAGAVDRIGTLCDEGASASSANEGLATSGRSIEKRESALVGAGLRSGHAPLHVTDERLPTCPAGELTHRTKGLADVFTCGAAADVAVGVPTGHGERSCAHDTVLDDPSLEFGVGSRLPSGWASVGQLGDIEHISFYEGTVYDLEIEDVASFVASGLVVHNCKPHHTGRMDHPSKDANGNEAVGIHEIPFPIWVAQVTNDWATWDLWAGTPGTLAVAPNPDTGGAVVIHAHPAHHPGLTVGSHLAADHPHVKAASKQTAAA